LIVCLFHLINQAAVPYFEMLDRWAREGQLNDPHQEFLVSENETIVQTDENATDLYWHQRFALRSEQCPAFLQRVQDKLLSCGKYLAVIRECGKAVDNNAMQPISFTQNER
jgi:gamma-tubulin complex component 2